MKTMEEKKEQLCHMVGDYSQDILECSYNDEDVFSALLSAEMESELKEGDDQRIINLKSNQPNIPIDQYHIVMMELVKELQVWPDGWMWFTPLEELDPVYKEIMERNKFTIGV